MTRTVRIAVLSLALLAGFTGPFAAQARDRGRGDAVAMADRAISLDEAVARAERRYEARAVRAEEERDGDRVIYRIRLLGADGRVFEVRVDAGTGREN